MGNCAGLDICQVIGVFRMLLFFKKLSDIGHDLILATHALVFRNDITTEILLSKSKLDIHKAGCEMHQERDKLGCLKILQTNNNY